MASREEGLSEELSEELELRQSALYAVGCICDSEAQEQQRERAARSRPAPTKDTLAFLADLSLKQAEVMASELQFFAAHANRKVIKSEDVLICARKLPALTKLLEKHQREHAKAAGTATGKRRRRTVEDSE